MTGWQVGSLLLLFGLIQIGLDGKAEAQELMPWGTMTVEKLGIDGICQEELELLMNYVEESDKLREEQALVLNEPSSPERESHLERLKISIRDLDNAVFPIAKRLILSGFWEAEEGRDLKLDLGVFGAVQHVFDVNVVRASLSPLLRLVRKGLLPGDAYATMYDRLAVTEARKQRFGTQFECENGRLAVYPLEDPDKVDERRKELGLMQSATEYARPFLGRRCA